MSMRMKRVWLKDATLKDFEKIEVGDWIEGVGLISTGYEESFVRNFGFLNCKKKGKEVYKLIDLKNDKNYQDLVILLYQKSFACNQYPIYILASGQQSRIYINCKNTTLDPKGMWLIGNVVFNKIKKLDARGIGGLTFGADPIAMAVSYASQIAGKPLTAFSIRKEIKDYGISRRFESDLPKNSRIIIVDDVVTTGRSVIKAVKYAQEEGYSVAHILLLVDRQEGGLEAIVEAFPQISVEALITVDQFFFIEKAFKSPMYGEFGDENLTLRYTDSES